MKEALASSKQILYEITYLVLTPVVGVR